MPETFIFEATTSEMVVLIDALETYDAKGPEGANLAEHLSAQLVETMTGVQP